MLSEVKELQNEAVEELVALSKEDKEEYVFKAPTGSGKTYMMADFMDRILSEKSDVVFLVSSPSKAGLAKQNFEKFAEYQATGKFANLDSFLIKSDTGGEAGVFIPANHNVYVLPYSLTQKEGKIMKGAFERFLMNVKGTQMKQLWLIVDEGHIAKNGLNAYKDFFKKTFYFSATPERLFKKKKHLAVDVEITEEDAISANLIKRVEYIDNAYLSLEEGLNEAIQKLQEVQDKSNKYNLGINPCLIIQVSNKTKGLDEIEVIKNCIEQANTGANKLQYAVVLDATNKGSLTNNKELMKLPVARWKEEIKKPTNPIDILIFKMVVTEGYDIPRAQLLYQVRETSSETLDLQVIGRVRRNPKLLEFEKLNPQAQEFLSVAYVWGGAGKNSGLVPVKLADKKIQMEFDLFTTKLKKVEEEVVRVDVSEAKDGQIADATSIFSLYQRYEKLSSDVKDAVLANSETATDWLSLMSNVDKVEKQITVATKDWQDLMELGEKTTVPIASYYFEDGSTLLVNNSIWVRADRKSDFGFDSEAERQFMNKLIEFSHKGLIKKLDDERGLFGKNYLANSNIGYQYYLDGVHTSYPDFLMKDSFNRVHIFEVKSINKSSRFSFDEEEYKKKIEALKKCYKRASALTDYFFYLPILGETWQIESFHEGEVQTLSMPEFEKSLKRE